MGKVKRELYETQQETEVFEPVTQEDMEYTKDWVQNYMRTKEYKEEHEQAFYSRELPF